MTYQSTDAARVRSLALRNAFVSGSFAKALSIVFGIVAIAICLRSLGVGPYGFIATLTGAISLFGFLDFGVGNALIRRVAAAHARSDEQELVRSLTNAVVFLLLCCAVVGLVGLTAALLVPLSLFPGAQSLDAVELRGGLVIFAISVAVAAPASIGSKIALGMQYGTQNGIYAVLASGCSLLGCAGAAALHGDVIAFASAFLVLPVAVNAVQTRSLLRPRGHAWRVRKEAFSWSAVGRMVPEGLPFTVLVVAGAVSYQTDILVVAYATGLGGAAAYGLLARVFGSLSVLLGSGLQQLWASTSHALASGDLPWVRRTFQRVLLITVGAYFFVTLGVLVFGRWGLSVWSGGAVVPEFGLIVAFSCWSLYAFVMSQLSTLLNGAGVVRSQAVFAVMMACLNLPLSIVLAQSIGPAGPLWASLITHALIVGGPTVYLVRRLFRGPQPSDSPPSKI